MNTLVQKFGGTSIGKADRMLKVVEIVKNTLQTHRPIIVLSAMSSYIKTEGTTSRLLEAAEASIKGGAYFKIIDLLAENHFSVVEKTITDRSIREKIEEQLENEFKVLKSFLDAIQVIQEISPRSQDVIIGTGEKLSALIFSGILQSQGIDATYVNLDNLIQKKFTETDHHFFAYLKENLKKRIADCGNTIPVVTGYFGFVPYGILKSIGRGYTDLTAALIAAACQAEELQIWKEVDGIFSADPRKVENAKVLPNITPEEAAELTYYGSEVIHPFTMEQVIKADIPIRIKNTFDPEKPGTVINPDNKGVQAGKPAIAVTVKKNISIININSDRMLMAYGFMAKVFNIFDRYGIIIDLISTSEVNISMTVDKDTRLEEALLELEKLGNVTVFENMAILSLVGHGMKHTVGVAGKMFSVISQEGINIEMISQGASEINISCVILDSDSDKALKAVYRNMLSD